MRTLLIAAGRVRSGPERTLFEDYAKRIPGGLELIEIEERKPVSGAERMRREADLIRRAAPPGAVVIALDEKGKALDSEGFAAALQGWRERGAPALVFVIGGADGLDAEFKASCHAAVALGPMTWPHRLCRVLLAEQIYRAESILAGHPYHRA
ncbi:MAG: 23S rRNA (pseudouridine(1915)-N(3))-methyltransferase RlmH [Rhodospirillales bacterium]